MAERFEIGYTANNGLMFVGLYDTERDIWGALTPLDNENNAPEWAMKKLESLCARLNAKSRKEAANG
jgi:hypothetical protein